MDPKRKADEGRSMRDTGESSTAHMSLLLRQREARLFMAGEEGKWNATQY
jgi:hypothetical protein